MRSDGKGKTKCKGVSEEREGEDKERKGRERIRKGVGDEWEGVRL